MGDAFLIGDAAHRVTPRGATGLNTAIRDGFDIGWKLGWVLRGWADARLLESYERERRPVAEFNTEARLGPTVRSSATRSGSPPTSVVACPCLGAERRRPRATSTYWATD